MKNIAFDFDKTLTYKDTLLGFFIFSTKKTILFPIKFGIYCAAMLLVKLKILNLFQLKSIGIWLFLKGLTKDRLRVKALEYSRQIKLNRVYNDEFFNHFHDANCKVYIVSASFTEYLSPLFPKIEIIASKIEYKDNKVDSLLFECSAGNKVKALTEQGITYLDIFYTDSISDAPVAEISRQIILVTGDRREVFNDYHSFISNFKS